MQRYSSWFGVDMYYVEEPKNKFSHIVFFLVEDQEDINQRWLEENYGLRGWNCRSCHIDISTGSKLTWDSFSRKQHEWFDGARQVPYVSESCPYVYGYQYAFKTKEEAMLFKLTWS